MLSIVIRRAVYFGAPALTGWYLFSIAKELSPTRKSIVQTTTTPSQAILDSYAIRKVINPHGFPSKGDSRATTIDVPSGVSDEQLLAWFVKGFFANRVFAPEAVALRMIKLSGPQFEGTYCRHEGSVRADHDFRTAGSATLGSVLVRRSYTRAKATSTTQPLIWSIPDHRYQTRRPNPKPTE
jgi:hypothetical protein